MSAVPSPALHEPLRGVLRPRDSKTFHRIPLVAPEGVTGIRLRFSYSPRAEHDPDRGREIVLRKLEEYRRTIERLSGFDPEEFDRRNEAVVRQVLPLRNLLNFCLYDPEGRFRGRWDSPQYFGEWIEVGREAATSRGFLAGPIPPGTWTVEIEVHAVVTEECEYVLEAELVADGEPASSGPGAEAGLPGRGRGPVEPAAPSGLAAPAIGRGPDWYRGELHLHTNHSDGKASLADMVAAARAQGLDFIVLSDHNTTSAHKDIPKAGFPVIPGMELTTYYGHAVALGVDTFVDWREGPDTDCRRQTDAVHAQGGLFSIAHPFVLGDPICTGCEWKYHRVDLSQVDLMEVWYGSWRKEWSQNALAFDWWNRLLNEGYRVVGVAARDVHDPIQFRLADAADTYVFAQAPTRTEILEGLRKGCVFVSSGPKLVLTLRAGDKEYAVGSEAEVHADAHLEWKARVEGVGRSAVLRLIADGARRDEFEVAGDQTVEWRMHPGDPLPRWLRAELWTRAEGVPGGEAVLAFTNPIFLRCRA